MNETLLIVEDEENDVFFLKDALRKAGILNPIQVVDDGRRALDYLSGTGKFADRKAYPLPAVVFLDLKLPQINGLGVLEWIREQPSLPGPFRQRRRRRRDVRGGQPAGQRPVAGDLPRRLRRPYVQLHRVRGAEASILPRRRVNLPVEAVA